MVVALAARLAVHNPGSEIRVVTHGAIEATELFGSALFDPFAGRGDPDRWMRVDAYRSNPLHRRADSFATGKSFGSGVFTWLLEEEQPVDWRILSSRLAGIIGKYGDVVLRMKGIIHTSQDGRPLVFHAVQRLFHPPVRMKRCVPQHRSSVVIIGEAKAEFAAAELADAFADAARAAVGAQALSPQQ